MSAITSADFSASVTTFEPAPVMVIVPAAVDHSSNNALDERLRTCIVADDTATASPMSVLVNVAIAKAGNVSPRFTLGM